MYIFTHILHMFMFMFTFVTVRLYIYIGTESRILVGAILAVRCEATLQEPEDLAEAWALRQLEVGLHRRRTGQQAAGAGSSAPSCVAF